MSLTKSGCFSELGDWIDNGFAIFVLWSGCAASSRLRAGDMSKQEDHQSHFENSWSPHDSIITCLRDGSAINWMSPTSDVSLMRCHNYNQCCLEHQIMLKNFSWVSLLSSATLTVVVNVSDTLLPVLAKVWFKQWQSGCGLVKVCTWSSLIYCFFSVQDKVERWQKAYQLQISPLPMSPHEPPQGNGPPHHVPLGVNMIVWSLDTCYILAAIAGEDFLACTMKCQKDCMIS
jgi:hypothetical protein